MFREMVYLIVTGVVSGLTIVFYNKIEKYYQSNAKKINKKILKTFVFLIQFILPVLLIIYFTVTLSVSKFYVLSIAVLSAVFIFNVVLRKTRRIIVLVANVVTLTTSIIEVLNKQVSGDKKVSDTLQEIKKDLSAKIDRFHS